MFQMARRNIVVYLIGINIAMFLLQSILGEGFTREFVLISGDIFARPWILLTSMFLHGGVFHLFINMYVLFMFGSLILQKIGTKRFLIAYFAAGIIAGFISSFIYPAALGASGAIMGILGVVIILMPDLQVLLFFIVPMSLRQAAILIAIIETFMIFVPTGIANVAHLVGLLVGLLYGLYLKKKRKQFNRGFSRKKHLSELDIEEYLRTGRI